MTTGLVCAECIISCSFGRDGTDSLESMETFSAKVITTQKEENRIPFCAVF